MGQDFSFGSIFTKIQSEGIPHLLRQNELAELYRFVRLRCSRIKEPKIVELGTYAGASAIVMAQAALSRNKSVVIETVDVARLKKPEEIRNNFEKVGLADSIKFIKSNDKDYIRKQDEHSIDLLFIDSDHRYDHVIELLNLSISKLCLCYLQFGSVIDRVPL